MVGNFGTVHSENPTIQHENAPKTLKKLINPCEKIMFKPWQYHLLAKYLLAKGDCGIRNSGISGIS